MSPTRGPRQSQPAVGQTPIIKEKTEAAQPKIWEPARFLSYGEYVSNPGHPYAVVILNQPIENVDLFLRLCSHALYIVCADGGANRVKDLNLSKADETFCKIDAICGDLDSLRPEVERYYNNSGSLIIKDPDQYSTDFTKCLKHISSAAAPEPRHSGKKRKSLPSFLSTARTFDVAVIGGFGGRADQAFSQMHHLYSASEDKTKRFKNIYLITTESIVFLLHQGLNRIRTPVAPGLFGECIGIIPVAKPSIITTRGLEWDVEKWPTEFGTQISTSNHIKASHVEVETLERVLFTVEIARKPEQEADTHRTKRRKITHDLDNPESAAAVVKAPTTLNIGIDKTPSSSQDRLNGAPSPALDTDILKRLDSIDSHIGKIVTLFEKTNERYYNNTKRYVNQTTLALDDINQLLTKAPRNEEVGRTGLAEIPPKSSPLN